MFPPSFPGRHGLLFGQPVAFRGQQGPALGGVTRQSWISGGWRKPWWTTVELKDSSSPYSPLKIEDISIKNRGYMYMANIWVLIFDPVLSCFKTCFHYDLIMVWSWLTHHGSRYHKRAPGSLVAAGPSVRSSKEVQISATVASPQLCARESATDWGSDKSWTCRIPWIPHPHLTSLRFTATDSWTNSLRHPHSAALRTSLKTTKP